MNGLYCSVSFSLSFLVLLVFTVSWFPSVAHSMGSHTVFINEAKLETVVWLSGQGACLTNLKS